MVYIDNRITKIRNDKEIKKQFINYPVKFRIEAVLHDGQWWNIEKLSTFSRTTISECMDFINNCDYLIQINNSYRVSSEEVLKWYKQNNLNISTPLVPNNFVPKIIDNKTELEHFIDVKPRIISYILFYYKSDFSLRDKIKEILKKNHCYCIDLSNKRRLKIFTVNTEYVINNLILPNLSDYEKENTNISIRTNVKWKAITDFPKTFYDEILSFYTEFVKNLIKPFNSTLRLFHPTYADTEAQIQDWLVTTISKFNPESGIPFSGYLSSVIPRWVFDLGTEELGVDLMKFQRTRNKAINIIKKKQKDIENVSEDEIFSLCEGYSREKYDDLLELHFRWLNSKQIDNLYLSNDNNNQIREQVGIVKPKRNTPFSNPKICAKITLCLLETALTTKDYNSLCVIFNEHKENQDLTQFNLSDEFKNCLWQKLKEKENEDK